MVTASVIVLSAWSLSSLLTVRLEETRARAELVIRALYHRAFAVIQEGGDPILALEPGQGPAIDPRGQHVLRRRALRDARRPAGHRDHGRAWDRTRASRCRPATTCRHAARPRACWTRCGRSTRRDGRQYELREPLLERRADRRHDPRRRLDAVHPRPARDGDADAAPDRRRHHPDRLDSGRDAARADRAAAHSRHHAAGWRGSGAASST